jgi:type VI secretion system secreted protein VgrG
MMSIPRIGQEVVVTYLEGDPDQPLIAGVVYNSEQMPVYPLPDKKTRSGLKTNSTPGGSGFNEMSMDDTAGQEQLFLHAQKDMDVRVLNDQRTSIMHDQHLTVHNDVREKIVKNKDVQIDGNVQETIKGSVRRTIGDFDHQIVRASRRERIDGFVDTEIGHGRHEKVGMDWQQTVGMNSLQKVGMNMAVDAGMAVHIKGGMTVVLEAGVQLTLKAGSNFIDISPAGIAISGMPAVLINSGGAAGVGSGVNVTEILPPDEPQPAKPDEADASAKSGQKSCP